MTRETWKRARQSFDAAYAEFRQVVLRAWEAKASRKDGEA